MKGAKYNLIWFFCVGIAVVLLTLPAMLELMGQRDENLWKEHTPTIRARDAAKMLLDENTRIVFVDIREWEEYNQFHIPSAVHIPLYRLREANVAIFEGADAVVPYCLKDFRGFEGAKILKGMGVKNVRILDGFGYSKWEKEIGVVAGKFHKKSDSQAMEELRKLMGEER